MNSTCPILENDFFKALRDTHYEAHYITLFVCLLIHISNGKNILFRTLFPNNVKKLNQKCCRLMFCHQISILAAQEPKVINTLQRNRSQIVTPLMTGSGKSFLLFIETEKTNSIFHCLNDPLRWHSSNSAILCHIITRHVETSWTSLCHDS
jgi:hypothetical protein